MENMDKKYAPMEKAEWTEKVENLVKIIEKFLNDNGYKKDSVFLDDNALFQIISKVNQRKQYFVFFHQLDISDFKEVALNCFWFLKLKPISLQKDLLSVEQRFELSAINEKFVVYYLIKEFRALSDTLEKPQEEIDAFFDEEYIYELVYSFMYRDISKEALILLVETMSKALGFNPYVKGGVET